MLAPKQPSDAQLAANRTNAQHSTGPRTLEGKTRTAQNALKHGLYSRDSVKAALYLGEDPAEFDTLLAELLEDFEPRDRYEHDLVQRVAGLTWRLARVHRATEEELAYRCSLTEEEAARGIKANNLFDGLLKSDALRPLETHLSRELSRMMRDLLFSQRSKLDFADKVNGHRQRVAERELKEIEAESGRRILGLQQEPDGDLDDKEGRDLDRDETESEAFDAEAAWKVLQKRRGNQPLSAESGEQTQSENAQETPQPGDGSSNLT